ncbi:MAG: bifunctional adenosylcobinamide kinase/adenosylcobinamide-phosphate guanylyltransferase [Bacilli bacterium]
MAVAFVFGGARSGKSAIAERLAASRQEGRAGSVLYIATAQASDGEMAERIRRHQTARPRDWLTVEEPLQVAGAVRKHADVPVILIDCLSLLVNNWMFLGRCDGAGFEYRKQELVAALQDFHGLAVCVSNEVGQGIVPADAATRQYRDWLGWLNQAVAAVADPVYWVAAGIPVDVRSLEAQL